VWAYAGDDGRPFGRRRELIQVGLWLGDSVAGAAAGITLSATLITLLR
jgi:hypothetical protein